METEGMLVLSLRDIFAPEMIAFITQRHMISFLLLFLLGSQIFGMGLAAKVFSFSKKFDYSSKSIALLDKYFSLERGIVTGSVLILLSFFSFIFLFVSYYWGSSHYLNELIRFDLAIFIVAFFMLGVQIIYTSFLLSLFYLNVK